jgi:hypothetical protein
VKSKMASNRQQSVGPLSLEALEREAIKALDAELREHGLLNERMFNLMAEAASLAPDLPLSQVSQSRKVCTVLLLRMRDDLRCAGLLALRGYQLQACSLVASIYEAAFTIAAIDSDDRLAGEWIEHDDPNHSFKSVLALTEMGLLKLGIPNAKEHAARRYLVYRQLCLPKHLNPVYQRQRGLKLLDRTVTVKTGPDTSEQGIREAWFALEHAAGLAFVATASFVENHVPPERRGGVTDKLKSIEADVSALGSKARRRWGTQNPFPDKWKS